MATVPEKVFLFFLLVVSQDPYFSTLKETSASEFGNKVSSFFTNFFSSSKQSGQSKSKNPIISDQSNQLPLASALNDEQGVSTQWVQLNETNADSTTGSAFSQDGNVPVHKTTKRETGDKVPSNGDTTSETPVFDSKNSADTETMTTEEQEQSTSKGTSQQTTTNAPATPAPPAMTQPSEQTKKPSNTVEIPKDVKPPKTSSAEPVKKPETGKDTTTKIPKSTARTSTELTTSQDALTQQPIIQTPKKSDYNPCKYHKHLTTFAYTCCRGQTYAVDKKLEQHFTSCYPQSSARGYGEDQSIYDMMWAIFKCMALKLNRGKLSEKLLMEMYAFEMPKEIKEEMHSHFQELEEAGILTLDGIATDDDRKLLRAAYYQIERGVCEENYKKPETVDKADYLRNATKCGDLYHENAHSRGDCCGNRPIPIPLDYVRRKLSSLKPKTCISITDASLRFPYEDSTLQQMCSIYCSLNEAKWLPAKSFSSPGIGKYTFPVQEAMKELFSAFSPSEVKPKLNKTMSLYMSMDAENFTSAIYQSLKENQLLGLIHHELVFTSDPVKEKEKLRNSMETAENWLIMCESWNTLVRNLETAIYSICY